MLSAIQDRSVQLLETIVERLEKYEQLQKRPKVFAKVAEPEHVDGAHSNSSHESNPDDVSAEKTEKLKQLSFELIDIGLHTTSIGLELV